MAQILTTLSTTTEPPKNKVPLSHTLYGITAGANVISCMGIAICQNYICMWAMDTSTLSACVSTSWWGEKFTMLSIPPSQSTLIPSRRTTSLLNPPSYHTIMANWKTRNLFTNGKIPLQMKAAPQISTLATWIPRP